MTSCGRTWDRSHVIAAVGAWPWTAAIVFLVIGVIALVTGLVGWCPIYRLFNMSTKQKAAA